jgi:serpin B
MFTKKILKSVACCLALLGSGLSAFKPDEPEQVSDNTPVCTALIHNTKITSNNFAHNLYQQFNTGSKNILFSPYSILTALAMTYGGAVGQTREELEAVAGFWGERWMFWGNQEMEKILRSKTSVNIANKIFAQENYTLESDFTHVLTEYFSAPIEQVNFATQDAIDTINNWVSKETREKIRSIVSKQDVNSSTRMVLANAVYFKGDWEKEFKANDTQIDVFYKLQDGAVPVETVPVDMMQQTETFKYVENQDLQLIELPYAKDNMSMFIALPRAGKLAHVEKTLTKNYLAAGGPVTTISVNRFENLISQMTMRTVTVKLPKFKFETSYSLKETLSGMGMPTAFSPAADFSGMTGNKDLYISNVLHKAVIEVDEKGSEAAAATAVVMNMKSTAHTRLPLTTLFEANRPFLFFIRDNETGLLLFTGRLFEPQIPADMST